MAPATVARTVKVRRPAVMPILEIDDDGVPVFETRFEGRRWCDDGEEPGCVALADWPAEFED